MQIDIDHIAKLSRLKIHENEREKMQTTMESIIHMVEKLPDIDSFDTLLDPDNAMTLRKDVVKQEFKRDELLKNAPKVQAGCVVVPKVVD